ncbi:hypothetical protein J2W49_000809 [Hydrogenophaga palleronii]|uniref:Sushi domain-containing protein n=1 Tax=Hydrogenophaga palleronii TaxID=65655 RepID=A0ABU1WI01_9BURK|nr:hypothetical protein [Hydrogenophaga palleronii]
MPGLSPPLRRSLAELKTSFTAISNTPLREALENMNSRHWMLCAALALSAGHCAAQSSRCDGVDAHGETGGAHFNSNLPYEQDVFSFCRIGYPLHCWISVVPSAGTWAWIPNCYPQNSQWIPSFTQTCPRSSTEGTWQGSGGPMEALEKKGDPNGSNGISDCEHRR